MIQAFFSKFVGTLDEKGCGPNKITISKGAPSFAKIAENIAI